MKERHIPGRFIPIIEDAFNTSGKQAEKKRCEEIILKSFKKAELLLEKYGYSTTRKIPMSIFGPGDGRKHFRDIECRKTPDVSVEVGGKKFNLTIVRDRWEKTTGFVGYKDKILLNVATDDNQEKQLFSFNKEYALNPSGCHINLDKINTIFQTLSSLEKSLKDKDVSKNVASSHKS